MFLIIVLNCESVFFNLNSKFIEKLEISLHKMIIKYKTKNQVSYEDNLFRSVQNISQ